MPQTKNDPSEIDRAHTESMKKVQSEHRAKMKGRRQAEAGLLAVYTGDGKGKSSSALGVILRALGWRHQVAMVQFIKGTWKTGEKQFFERFSDLITIRRMGEGFTWDTQDRQRDIAAARAAWETSLQFAQSGDYDLVVLDELNIALRYEYLEAEEVVAGLGARHQRTTVLVTGRDAPPALIDAADLVSEMRPVKHPFDAGIRALRGFDF